MMWECVVRYFFRWNYVFSLKRFFVYLYNSFSRHYQPTLQQQLCSLFTARWWCCTLNETNARTLVSLMHFVWPIIYNTQSGGDRWTDYSWLFPLLSQRWRYYFFELRNKLRYVMFFLCPTFLYFHFGSKVPHTLYMRFGKHTQVNLRVGTHKWVKEYKDLH